MMYKIPMPNNTNGVKLYRLNGEQMALEYQKGEPHVSGMAMDSALGKPAKTITIRRPDIDKIIAEAVRQVDAADALPRGTGIERSKGKMAPRGGLSINDDSDTDTDTDTDAAMAKVMDFLENIISPDDLEIVQALFLGAADVDEAREQQAVARRDDDRRTGRQATDQATDRRRSARLAADAARNRPMSASAEREFLKLFPDANRLLLR